MDQISNYVTNPVLPTSLPPRDRWISGAAAKQQEEYIELFINGGDSVSLQSSLGQIGRVGDSSFSTLSDGMPIIPITGTETPPIGYFLPRSDWRCRTAGFRVTLTGSDYSQIRWDSFIATKSQQDHLLRTFNIRATVVLP